MTPPVDLTPDSSDAPALSLDRGFGSSPPPLPPPPPSQRLLPQPSLPPAKNVAGEKPPTVANKAVGAMPAEIGNSGPAAIPPPPPPRNPSASPTRNLVGIKSATLNAGNDIAASSPRSGIGATTGIRWQGEIGDLQSRDKVTAPQEYQSRSRLGRWIAAAPSWLISTVLHLILFIILALITLPPVEGLGRIVFEMGTGQPSDAVAFDEFEISPMPLPTDTEFNDVEEIEQIEMPAIVESIEPLKIESLEFSGGSSGESGIKLVPMFGGRSGAMKKALLAAYGGTTETMAAVEMGLEWLKRNQRRDGTWSLTGPYRDGGFGENKCAATAMALLAFTGDGNTHLSGPYKDEVNKGVRALVKMQDRTGFMADQGQKHSRAYAQAQASIALCELYGMTGDSWLRPYAEASINYAVKSQSPQGGWRYDPNSDSDTSVTGWFVMALQSAKAAGLDFDQSVFHRVSYFLDSVQSEDGAAYSYQPLRPASEAMRAEGLLCRQYLGWDRHFKPLGEGVGVLVREKNFDINQRNVYYWYYATQVLHHFGESPWQMWNGRMKEQLPEAQVRRGEERGSWPPQMDEYGSTSGRLYTTCLSIYCLEVYYRHMPIYDLAGKGAVGSDQPAKKKPSD
jgi:hypothetical protein